MHRSKKKRNIVIISLIIVLLAMVVGYATYSSNIELEGTTKITSNWDIRITNGKTPKLLWKLISIPKEMPWNMMSP